MDNATNHLNNCPKCGIKINKASGRCPSCGFLFGGKHRAAQQQQSYKPQSARPSRTPTSQNITSQRPSRGTPVPKTIENPFAKVKKEQPIKEEPSITSPPATEVPAVEKELPTTEAKSVTLEITETIPAPEEPKPTAEDIDTKPTKHEEPAPMETQPVEEATESTPPTTDEVPYQEELPLGIEVTSITPPTIDQVPTSEPVQSVAEDTSAVPQTTDEAPASVEEQPAKEDPSVVPPAVEISTPEEEQQVTETCSSPSPAIDEAPSPEEKQTTSQALSIISPPATPAVPPPKEIQLVSKALKVRESQTPLVPASREIQVFTEVTGATPPKTEVPTHDEKQPDTEPPIVTPPPAHKVPAPEAWEPGKYQSVFTTGGWYLPPVNILDKPTEIELSQSDVEKRARLIEEAINSYGVEAKVVQINVGPTVTQFGVEPGWDRKYKKIRERDEFGNVTTRMEEISKTRVKVDRISTLASDLALALAAPSIRIEAPVPGKSVVGIEVPNTTFSLVNLRGVIESASFQKAHAKSKLALALGKGAGGETVAGHLDRMPHLLIAGATGSGKTACLNSIICCLLIHNTPDDVQFIMIDPKRVELVNFNSLPHLAAPVVIDTEKAVFALRWLNQEMDNRYNRFAQAGVRNIDSYNTNRQFGDTMPYIVVVIDELADLMMAAFDEVERTLCRLAQLARATGIHMIVATQRPSVDVVTGLIKANFPTRISFALTSQVDSRTILDSAGAEKLLGRGDMLYMPTDASKPKRLQGTFISDTEIERIVDFWGNQRRPEIKPIRFEDMSELDSNGKNGEDTLLEAARQLSQEYRSISTSFLQRRLRIGYPRAARIMEKLEEEGYSRGTAEPNGE